MTPFEIIWEYLSGNLEYTDYWLPVVVCAVIVTVDLWGVPKLRQRRYQVGAAVMSLGLIVLEFDLLLKWNLPAAHIVSGALLIFPVLCFLVPLLWNKWQIQEIKELCGQRYYVKALEALDSMHTGWLTTKQVCDYQRTRFLALVYLGNLWKAAEYLERICPNKENQGAFYHFALHILAYHSGDLQTSFSEIKLAENSADVKNDLFLQFQIIMNYGVCYAAEQNYHLADEYFHKAISFYDEKKLRDKDLLVTYYYNVAYNRLRLSPSTTEWSEALDECQARLNMETTDAQISMLNLRLEMLRQTGASREVIDQLLRETFTAVLSKNLPLRNQVFFASSVVRVAWAAQVDPIPALKLLYDNIAIIENLPAQQRYHVYAELENVFRDLRGPSISRFATLKDRVSNYMAQDAECDLRQWQSELPEEAVYERCDCLKKMAVLHRRQGVYDYTQVVTFQQNAIRLYHDSRLYLEELRTHLDVIDELLDERNRDEDHRPSYMDEIRDHLASAEELYLMLDGHPALVDSYIRMGCYYLNVDEYEKGLDYMQLFRNADISVQNFAPWLRRYYATLLLHARAIMFDHAIRAAAEDKQVQTLARDVQNWFAAYPNHDGSLETTLLGRFMSVGVEKIKLWTPDRGPVPQGHFWLWMPPPFGLNIDLTYPQFVNDRLYRCIFFYGDRHPFEAGTSLTLQSVQKDCPFIFEGIAYTPLADAPDPETRQLVDTIYDFVCAHLPGDCPTIEECIQLFREFSEPVPIQSHT